MPTSITTLEGKIEKNNRSGNVSLTNEPGDWLNTFQVGKFFCFFDVSTYSTSANGAVLVDKLGTAMMMMIVDDDLKWA